MTKKKSPKTVAYDKGGPQDLAPGFTWCDTCQAAFQGEVCPGCSPETGSGMELDPFAAGASPGPIPPGCAACTTIEPGGTIPSTEDGKCLACGRDLTPATLAEVAEQASTETTTITEILPVPITDAEYKEIGLKMGAANQEIIQAENELKSVKSQYKSRIDSAKTRRDEYASIINAGHQQKQVECHLVKDFQANTITLVRLDTGEVVRTRTMTTAERQRGLGFEE